MPARPDSVDARSPRQRPSGRPARLCALRQDRRRRCASCGPKAGSAGPCDSRSRRGVCARCGRRMRASRPGGRTARSAIAATTVIPRGSRIAAQCGRLGSACRAVWTTEPSSANAVGDPPSVRALHAVRSSQPRFSTTTAPTVSRATASIADHVGLVADAESSVIVPAMPPKTSRTYVRLLPRAGDDLLASAAELRPCKGSRQRQTDARRATAARRTPAVVAGRSDGINAHWPMGPVCDRCSTPSCDHQPSAAGVERLSR